MNTWGAVFTQRKRKELRSCEYTPRAVPQGQWQHTITPRLSSSYMSSNLICIARELSQYIILCMLYYIGCKLSYYAFVEWNIKRWKISWNTKTSPTDYKYVEDYNPGGQIAIGALGAEHWIPAWLAILGVQGGRLIQQTALLGPTHIWERCCSALF